MPNPGMKCAVCSTPASQKCATCAKVSYCGKEHQKEAWPQHKYFCHEPYQMGLYATGQSQTVTPVFIPKSTGNLQTLSRDKLGRMLACATKEIEIVVSPMSTLFVPEHRIVCAYNAGPGGLMHSRGPKPSPAFSSAPGELCSHAVHMTRSLVHSFGSQINGSVLFFYLHPGKDFLARPDFNAAQEAIEAWNEADGDCSQDTFKKLAEVFATSLIQRADPEKRVDYFDAIIFPALDGKPFITKHPFQYVPPDDVEDCPCHTIDTAYVLGDTSIGICPVGYTPSRGNLRNELLVYIRDRFLMDGSPLNKSIQVATKGEARHSWAGNIVVMKHRERSEIGMDADADDVKIALEYFRGYGA